MATPQLYSPPMNAPEAISYHAIVGAYISSLAWCDHGDGVVGVCCNCKQGASQVVTHISNFPYTW